VIRPASYPRWGLDVTREGQARAGSPRLQMFASFCTLASMADVTKTFRDAGYMTIGLGVLAFQRAQVRRRELTRQLDTQRHELRRQLDHRRQDLETQVTGLRAQLADRTKDLERRIEPLVGQLENQLESGLDRLEQRLPDPARGAVHQARHQAAEVRSQLSQLPPLSQLRGALAGGSAPDGNSG